MEKYHGFDQQFYDFLFQYVVEKGGVRMQILAADLVNDLQKNYDTKDPLNLFRKQYGNIYEALKAIKNQFYILDNMVIRMKKPEEVRSLNIKPDLMAKYETTLAANEQKQIQVMKQNNQNKCQQCSKIYNVNVNKAGLCSPGKAHEAKY